MSDGRGEVPRRVHRRAVPRGAARAVLRARGRRAGRAGGPVAAHTRARARALARAARRPTPPRRVGGHAAAVRAAARYTHTRARASIINHFYGLVA